MTEILYLNPHLPSEARQELHRQLVADHPHTAGRFPYLFYLGQGSDRAAFLLPSRCSVLKLQHNYTWGHQNEREFTRYRAGLPVAACRLLSDGALLQRYVPRDKPLDAKAIKTITRLYPYPSDGYQGGFTRLSGKPVLYDAGL